jgi:prepilin-type N-terminal cleavage/methylation domain-containing protein
MIRFRLGFTLIELLVVITIMAVLMGLFISLVEPIRKRLRIGDTKLRMEAVQNGMAVLGQNEGSAAYVIQKLTERRTTGTPTDPEPGLGGILTFGRPTVVTLPDGSNESLPTIGFKPPPQDAVLNGDWGLRGSGHLAFPWGKKFPQRGSADNTIIGPEKFRLRDMSPFNTRKLLSLANILPTRTSTPDYANEQYTTNRKESEPWNDRWGHPLVVAAVLYQPTYLDGTQAQTEAWPATGSTPIRSSSYKPLNEIEARRALLEHLKLYQYNRSVYIAVASVGPSARVSDEKLKSTSAADWASSAIAPVTGNLKDLWDQANEVCQQAKVDPYDRDWTELSFDNPPWQGVRDDYKNRNRHAADKNVSPPVPAPSLPYAGKEEHCLLSAPREY